MRVELVLNSHDRALLERIAVALESGNKILAQTLPTIADELKQPPDIVDPDLVAALEESKAHHDNLKAAVDAAK